MKNPTNRKFDRIEETYKKAFITPLIPILFFIVDIAYVKSYIILHPVLLALYIISMVGIFGIAIAIKVLFSKDLALQENENSKGKVKEDEDITDELTRLKKLYDENTISKEEYELLKQKAINKTIETKVETEIKAEVKTENNDEVNQ